MGWKRTERTENSSSRANVLHRTLNLVISRRHLGDDGKEMYQNVKRTCRAIVFAHLTYCFVASSLSSASSFRKLPSKEFKKRRRLRLRKRQKAVILLVKRTKMLVLHAWLAFLNISLPHSSKLQREMTKFKVSTTTWANCSESFSLTLYFKSVRTNPVIGHFAHIV